MITSDSCNCEPKVNEQSIELVNRSFTVNVEGEILTSNCGRPRAVNLIAVIPVPNVAPGN